MKIGKTIKVVTSPKREVKKAGQREYPIPVQLPEKVPDKVPEKTLIPA